MSDFAPTPGNVVPVTNAANGIITQIVTGQASAAITAGLAVYKSGTVAGSPPLPTFQETTSDNATSASVFGIALNNAKTNQRVDVAVGGDIFFGAGLTLNVGDNIGLSSTSSALGWLANEPVLIAGQYPNNVGVMVGTTQCRLCIA